MPATPPLIVVMGVSGSGKTTIGQLLASRLGVPFEDADSLHPAANVAKMAAGHPLTDADRRPWLASVGRAMAGAASTGMVMACSALKRAYRDILVHGRNDVRIVYLNGTQDLIASRLALRKDHFMPPGLLASQFKTLEPPDQSEHPVTVPIDAAVAAIVDDIVRQLGLSPADNRAPRRNQS
jgi:gluconokinase